MPRKKTTEDRLYMKPTRKKKITESELQHLCDALVGKEVYYCFSHPFHTIATHPETWKALEIDEEEVYNLSSSNTWTHRFEYSHDCPGHEDPITWEREDEESIEVNLEGCSEEKQTHGRCPRCWKMVAPSSIEAKESDPIEALEHWIVSDYLAGKLKARGEMVGEFMGLTIWGRATSGQAIAIDHVIRSIVLELDCLELRKA